jgi:hypothetical protein
LIKRVPLRYTRNPQSRDAGKDIENETKSKTALHQKTPRRLIVGSQKTRQLVWHRGEGVLAG